MIFGRSRLLALVSIVLTTTGLALASSGASSQTQPGLTPGFDPASLPDVVARVNGTDLTKDALVRSAKMFLSQMPEGGSPPPDFYQRVVDELVSSELLFQEAKASEVIPTDAEVDAEVENRKSQMPDRAAFEQMLQQQGMTLMELKDEVRRGLGIQRFIESRLVPNVTVTPEEIQAFYDENQTNMERPQQFRASHILFRVDEGALADHKEQVRKKAMSVRGMIEAGQDFAELASKNSDDPGSKDNGGELPWMSSGQTVPPFETAAMALEPGELSEVVETEFGFHVIKLLEKRAEGVVSFDEAKPRIEYFLKQQNLQRSIGAEVEKLKVAGKVEILI